MPSSINKNVKVDVPIVGDCAPCARGADRAAGRPDQGAAGQAGDRRVVAADRRLAGAQDRSRYKPGRGAIIKPQYAIQRLYELTRETGETYITTEVGQHQMWAAQYLRLPAAEPLDDLGRARHHGLRPAGRDRRADGASAMRW